jgi:hypothetical protein
VSITDTGRGPLTIEYHERPGLTWSDERLRREVAALRAVAERCFAEIPEYQCLQESREALADKAIAIARTADGGIAGFCSAIILPVPGVGHVLHLGLTCIGPGVRGGGLTHRLTSKVVVSYLLRHHLFSRLWITNVACVLSSLGNVALHFDDVFPGPQRRAAGPSARHLAIARAIDAHHRQPLYVLPEARFDEQAFVFRGSVRGTVFQKRVDDARYHHRDPRVTGFYAGLMNFDEGDEVLQVGNVSLLTWPRYQLRKLWPRHAQAALPAASTAG